MIQDNSFEAILMSIYQQTGSINAFFDQIYGFLRRNTDFFTNQETAEKMLVDSFKRNHQKFKIQFLKLQKEEQKTQPAIQIKEELSQALQKMQGQEQKKAKKNQNPEKLEAGYVKLQNVQVAPNPVRNFEQSSQEYKNYSPKGNGCRTQRYIWTQTLQTIEMYIFNPAITKKTTKVTITQQKLIVIIDGVTVIDGKWKGRINKEDTFWCRQEGQVEDNIGKYIYFNIQKEKNQRKWCSTPIQGDAEIDIQKIKPETPHLGNIKVQARATVGERGFFDIRQKEKLFATNDELSKQQKLKEFMKAHPELDFSQCKFS